MPRSTGDKKPEKSYLSSAVESINPWAASRSATPAPDKRDEPSATAAAAAAATAAAAVGQADPGDHSVTPLYGQSFRTYPKGCPPLSVQWFHAADVPKRKPQLIKGRKAAPTDDKKPPARPKKFTAFSPSDSKRIEARYQKLLEAAEDSNAGAAVDTTRRNKGSLGSTAKGGIRVPVNEDFLFNVDIEERELAPVYWLGPVYEVRRGTWFFQEGSNLRPCEENLASQLEEGYLKMKPWLHPVQLRGSSKDAGGQAPGEKSQDTSAAPASKSKPAQGSSSPAAAPAQPPPQPQQYRLFGAYMSNIATYQDAATAWLSTDGVLSWMTATVYERFAGGGYMSGVKLVRGYTEPNKTKDKEDKSQAPSSQAMPGLDEQQFSSLTGSEEKGTAETEEQIRRRLELEIEDDYNAQAGEIQGRELEHLVLVTHGIGQRLGLRMESINFVHDVNVLRKTLKSVYADSADLRALNSELGAGPGNCRVQVLPVCWRHLIEFPKQRQRKGEYDLGDVAGEDEYPSLEDITVEGVAFARSLISDLALDVLLYQSSYREEIARVVVAETNRILRIFRERNPDFKGRVHLMGHSLGSAIFFDVLCRQREQPERQPLRFWPSQGRQGSVLRDHDLQFDFDVHNYFCLGSPVGLFQMLKGRTIAARPSPHGPATEDSLLLDEGEAASAADGIPRRGGLQASVSSPKVGQLYNIFHPSDPVSYRLEPLVSPAMATLRPQSLPYTKKGIFSNVAPQSLTGIGAKVGQSVSGLWSSLSAGIASNLINRSLGLSSEEVARLAASETAVQQQHQPGAEEKTEERKQQLADSTAAGQQNATLIDDELETLYATFQRSHMPLSKEHEAATDEEGRRARKLRAEETKVRALNRNGRVDYCIQESALDFNPINTIASHVGYWADEDVNHFILSQLLSSRPRADKKAS